MKIAVIGAGISGLSVARMLHQLHDVTVFEKYPTIGGLIKCEYVEGNLFHKVGGHVFNSKNNSVLDWFWSNVKKEDFVQVKRNAKILFNNQVIGYPIENYLYTLGKDVVVKIIKELLELHKADRTPPLSFPNFKTFLLHNFGPTLFELYFKPYNEKIWRIDLETVSMAWLEGKLPMPDLNELLSHNVLREEESEMVHSTFFYPRKGGSQFIVDQIAQGLDIRTSNNVHDAGSSDGKFFLETEEGFEAIIYTGNITTLPDLFKSYLKADGMDPEELTSLRYNGTSNLFCITDEVDVSWLYIPENFTQAHRIIYTGNFSDENNAGPNQKTCVVEFSGQVAYETMCEEIKKLPGNLKPIASNYQQYSYVIQDHSTRKIVSKARSILESHNIYLLGRFAEWEYYNMDKCIEAAFLTAEKINTIK